ncbi:hypothetical protein Rhal01_02268 [Rubritalea halochordaticola]|uniref:Sulfatase N-terminal domain-containing protein n=2 Tax=Rubritalea halochordaticola TaxID=714537 RepID=A0ABP9V638_9BACT
MFCKKVNDVTICDIFSCNSVTQHLEIMRILKNLLLSALISTPLVAQEKPNILFIFCDDLGYGDVGVFWQNQRKEANKPDQPWFSTPHIDQMAAEGMLLHAHYCAAPVCAPSRASLFMGRHQGNAPIRDNQFDKVMPNQPTLGTTLKQAGYHTALIGKWGLQGKGKNSTEWPSYPTKRGFDYFLGGVRHRDGHEHYPYDQIHFKNKRTEIWEQDKEISEGLKGCYTTDLFTAATKKWLVDHKKESSDKPFFLFLSYDTPHAATQIATSPYPKGYGVKGGVQWIGKKGRMINTANNSPDNYIHPDYADKMYDHDSDPSTPLVPWTNVSKRYASSIRRIDNSVQDIIQTLKDLGMDENTLIVFTSDHGPSKESYIKENLQPGFFDSFGPFTGIKRDCWEGGIRPGAIVRWPKAIKAGSETELPSQMNDWMATFCEAAGTPIPAIADGTSLIPSLTGKGEQEASTIYVEYTVGGGTPKYAEFPKSRQGAKRGQMQVVREGKLKAIRYNTTKPDTPFMVFDVTKDPREENNLAGKPGIPSQEHWIKAVSRLHGVEKSAKRPYDKLAVSALDITKTTPGVTKKASDKQYAYAYRLTDAKTTTAGDLSISETKGNIEFSGYLKVEKDGSYGFEFAEGVNGVLRIHDILTLDTDSPEPAHATNSLKLTAGYHPFTLTVRANGKATKAPLLWKAPGADKAVAITAASLSH